MNTIQEDLLQESERIKAVKRYAILDTPADGSFDHIASLAARLLDVPIAIISIVDTDRIWFKSSIGLNVQQIGRDPGLCSSAILSNDVYLVKNALTDARTFANPLVAGELGLRFYASAPLKVKGGFNLGTLCVIDKEPRTLGEHGKQTLTDLAELVVDQLELRLEARKGEARQNQLITLVAHEMKNSLTTIPAYSELLMKEVPGNPTVVKMCTQILRASGRMKDLVEDMLEMALLQSDEIQLKKNNFDLAAIVGRVAANNLVLADAKQQKLFLDITGSLMVHADETKMAEIADNLINNAIKYSPPGGEISVKLTTREQKIVLEVRDEGPGLSEFDKGKLFMPFTRLSARPTAGESSTGIGLSIVKLLVDAHGGIVVAENNPEKRGAIFKVEIPASMLS